jgi:predicted glycosyltransferase
LNIKKKILVAPLNWGLGHATRCMPIIERLLHEGNEVLIGADGAPLVLLKARFPQCTFIDWKGVSINYSGNMIFSMLIQVPKILWSIYKEHQHLEKVVEEYKIDMVISDNRFGLWNKKIHSVFITHQVNIISPFAEKLLFKINKWFIEKYDECWVPDYEGALNLSGDLSHPKNEYYKKNFPKNLKYIGPQSRFTKGNIDAEKKYEVVGIVSGPEPQRTLFFEKLKSDFEKINGETLIIAGTPNNSEFRIQKPVRQLADSKLSIVPHLEDNDFVVALYSAKKIICRSGYSTIMDLHVLGLKAEFVATKGQTEQEYLENMHKD